VAFVVLYIIAILSSTAIGKNPKYKKEALTRSAKATFAWFVAWILCCFSYVGHEIVGVALGRAHGLSRDFYTTAETSFVIIALMLYLVVLRPGPNWKRTISRAS
jgi:amino acid permease